MNYAEISIVKRDGKKEDFSISKIKNAITKAFNATGITNEDKLIADITMQVIAHFTSSTISVEAIQDLVEKELMKVRPEVAKKYIIYREWRNTERDKKTQMKHIMDGIVAIDKNDINLSNANMSSHTPAGQMMTFASEVTKDYTYRYLLPKRFAEAHQLGMKVNVWTVNDMEMVQKMIDQQVDYITTEYPLETEKLIRKNGGDS